MNRIVATTVNNAVGYYIKITLIESGLVSKAGKVIKNVIK